MMPEATWRDHKSPFIEYLSYPWPRCGESTSTMMGKSAITDGKVEGDTVTFTLAGKFGDQEVKLNYTGKIAGSEIKFSSEMAGGGGGGAPIQWIAKKM